MSSFTFTVTHGHLNNVFHQPGAYKGSNPVRLLPYPTCKKKPEPKGPDFYYY